MDLKLYGRASASIVRGLYSIYTYRSLCHLFVHVTICNVDFSSTWQRWPPVLKCSWWITTLHSWTTRIFWSLFLDTFEVGSFSDVPARCLVPLYRPHHLRGTYMLWWDPLEDRELYQWQHHVVERDMSFQAPRQRPTSHLFLTDALPCASIVLECTAHLELSTVFCTGVWRVLTVCLYGCTVRSWEASR